MKNDTETSCRDESAIRHADDVDAKKNMFRMYFAVGEVSDLTMLGPGSQKLVVSETVLHARVTTIESGFSPLVP